MTARAKKIECAVVPAAGKGTRLMPLTKAVPKELIPLGRRPVLEHIVEEIVAAGIHDICFVISRSKESIKAHFGNCADGVNFEYVYQDEQKGLAHAIYCAKEYTSTSPFAVVLGDSVIYSDNPRSPFLRTKETFENTEANDVVMVQECKPEETVKYGIVDPYLEDAESMVLRGLVEKPRPEDAPSKYAIAGRYVFSEDIYSSIESTTPGANSELQITDSIALEISSGREVRAVPLLACEKRVDIGTFDTYFEALRIEMDR